MRLVFASVAVLLLASAAVAPAAQAQRRRRPTEPAPAAAPEAAPEASPPAAEAPVDPQLVEARALFAAGAAAVESGRWVDAVDSFRRAYALTNAPSALYNLAFALRALGRHVEARAAFDELLALEGMDDATREEATRLRDEVAARVATLRLEGLADVHYTLRLDGAEREDPGTRPLLVEADPGTHHLDVTLTGRPPFGWDGRLADGQVLALEIDLAPVVAGKSIVEEPLFWIITGAVLALGAGVVTWVVADDAAQLRPLSPIVVQL